MLVLCALLATPAAAQQAASVPEEGWLYELSAGVLAHDVDGLWSGSRAEDGVDVNAELVLRRPSFALLSGSIAEKAKAAGVDTVAFDRSGFRYHGRVKALADAAREAGLKF